jgi:hypothetical protein
MGPNWWRKRIVGGFSTVQNTRPKANTEKEEEEEEALSSDKSFS